MGKPAETDRRPLKSLSHSFTLDWVITCKSAAEARVAVEAAGRILKQLGVELHPQSLRLPNLRPALALSIEEWAKAVSSAKELGACSLDTITYENPIALTTVSRHTYSPCPLPGCRGSVYAGRKRTTANQSGWPRCQARSQTVPPNVFRLCFADRGSGCDRGEVSAVLVRFAQFRASGESDDVGCNYEKQTA